MAVTRCCPTPSRDTELDIAAPTDTECNAIAEVRTNLTNRRTVGSVDRAWSALTKWRDARLNTKEQTTNRQTTRRSPWKLKSCPLKEICLARWEERRETEEEPSPSLPPPLQSHSALFVLVPPMETGCPPLFPPQRDPSEESHECGATWKGRGKKIYLSDFSGGNYSTTTRFSNAVSIAFFFLFRYCRETSLKNSSIRRE